MRGVRGEILRDAQRATKLHYSHQTVGPGGGIDKLGRRAPSLNLVRRIHGGIIEE